MPDGERLGDALDLLLISAGELSRAYDKANMDLIAGRTVPHEDIKTILHLVGDLRASFLTYLYTRDMEDDDG